MKNLKKVLFVALCFGFPLLGFSSSVDSAAYYLKQAISFKEGKRLFDADKSFQKAIQFNPSDNNIRVEYVNFLIGERKYFVASEQLQKMLQVNSNHPVALQRMLEVDFLLHRWNDVIAFGKKLLQMNKGERIKYMMGRAYYEEEDYGEAEKLLTEAVKESPTDLETITLLGKVYIELSEYRQAINAYNQALQLDPNNNKLIYEFGLLHYSLNKEREAVMYFEMAAEKGYKQDLDFTENLGMAYLSFDTKKGVEILGKVLAKKPNNAEIMLQIAGAYYKRNDYQTAADTYYKIYEIDPTHSRALYMTGVSYIRKGDKNKGALLCEQAIVMDPKLSELKKLMFAK